MARVFAAVVAALALVSGARAHEDDGSDSGETVRPIASPPAPAREQKSSPLKAQLMVSQCVTQVH